MPTEPTEKKPTFGFGPTLTQIAVEQAIEVSYLRKAALVRDSSIRDNRLNWDDVGETVILARAMRDQDNVNAGYADGLSEESTWGELTAALADVATMKVSCTCGRPSSGHARSCAQLKKTAALETIRKHRQHKADAEGPDWPIKIKPCRFPTEELGLQHPEVEVIPAAAVRPLLDAIDRHQDGYTGAAIEMHDLRDKLRAMIERTP